MKFKLLSLTLCALLSFGLTAQKEVAPEAAPTEIVDEVSKEGPKMDFVTLVVEYGTIDQHSEPLRTVDFTNTGTEPLVIKNARGSCGCTVPIWPKEPIMPGETSVIEIRYDTKRLGKINKTVKITTNEGTEPHVLKVVGNILKAEAEESVPASTPNMLNSGGE